MVEIVDNMVLIVDDEYRDVVTSSIPKSKEVTRHGAPKVAVYWGLEEARRMAMAGVPAVPSPILRDYQWTGRLTPFDHQRHTASFLTLHERAFCLNEQGCVDADTEYLSPTGWVRIADYTGGAVAQYHPDTGRAEFVDPEEFVKLPCADMVRIRTHYGLDQLLSPEHRVLLVDGKNPGKREVLPALELMARHDAYHAGARARVGGTRGGTPTIAFSAAAVPTTFSCSGGSGLPLTDAQLRLQVAVMADGHFGSESHRCVVRVKKVRKIERLRSLLSAAGVPFTEQVPEYPTAPGFHVFTFHAPRRDKVYTAPWWDATEAQLRVIADEVLHWDACTTRGRRFSTSVRASADFVQYAFVATGRTARVLTAGRVYRGRAVQEYTVQVRDNPHLWVRGSTTTVAPAPSTDGYKYCFRVPSTFLVFRRNGCVFASGNTGKTASVIWAADYLMRLGGVQRVLVLCPLSIMDSAWRQDLFKFAMHRSCSVAHGTAKQRAKIIAAGSEFVVMNFDGLAVVEQEVLAGGFDLIVVDEANAYKTATTARWKVFNRVVNALNPRLWMLTGTPAAQSPLDAYGLARLVNPQGCPKFFGAFRDSVMYKVTQFKWSPRPEAEKVVHRILQPAIRFEKKDCLDLPDVTYVERHAPMTPMQMKYYRKLKEDMLIEAAGEDVSAVNAATKMNKLLQISSGAVYSDDGAVLEFDVSNRVTAVMEVIEEAANKVLVFVPFTHTIELLRAKLLKAGISCDVLNGKVPVSRRGEIVQEFQTRTDPQVLIIQPQAASHGLTLTAADTIIWYAPVTSVETYLQANARINRPGQKNAMTIVHIRGSDVEARLYHMLQTNIATHDRVIDLYRQAIAEPT